MHNKLICDLDWDSQFWACSLLAYLNSRTYVIMCICDLYFDRAATTVSFSLSLSCSLLIPLYDLVCCLIYSHLAFVSPAPSFHLYYHFL